jgi:hypothetical protein
VTIDKKGEPKTPTSIQEELKIPKLKHTLELLFPKGTIHGQIGFTKLPRFSTDVFAAAAYLLEHGGAYHRIVQSTGQRARRSRQPWSKTNLIIKEQEVEAWRQLGVAWYEAAVRLSHAQQKITFAKTPKATRLAEREVERCSETVRQTTEQVQIYWDELLSFFEEPLVDRSGHAVLPWWKPAVALLIISDEACKNLGYHIDASGSLHPIEAVFQAALYTTSAVPTSPVGKAYSTHETYNFKMNTFTFQANTFLARVIPKSRTSTLGCSMRNLSHNVALVPPQGIVDLNWFRRLRFYEEDREPLNLLLIPFPFRIGANCFRPDRVSKPMPTYATDKRTDHQPMPWGSFCVDQRWLNKEGLLPASSDDRSSEPWKIDSKLDDPSISDFVAFVINMLEAAEKDCGRLHGIVLPELALNWTTYVAIIDALSVSHTGRPRIDFFVAGCSSDGRGSFGNYVLTTIFEQDDGDHIRAFTHSRAKHHRWQLTGSQITEYGLASSLDPNLIWWEGNELPRREIDLTVFRSGAMFSAMICEDLARSDPCHDPLRGVGPNLVFALLMDGPQLQTRWSARYATALADDPGSSVLTLSSLGLIDRINKNGRHPQARHVALWKDDTGRIVSIELPPDSQGILLTLSGAEAVESTIDGRVNRESQAWRYHGHIPVSVNSKLASGTYSWIFRV